LKYIKKTIVAGLLGISTVGNTAQDIGHVKKVFVFTSSYGFSLVEGFPNAAEDHKCNSSGAWASIPVQGNNHSKEMYSAILTALAAGKKVYINTNGCTGDRFNVSGVYVEKS
jgi:ABC-type sugar transport system substrate-binding protein